MTNLNKSEWYDAENELPLKDETSCLLYVQLNNEFENAKYYDIGYVFADKWYDEKEHELIEVNGCKILYWMEIPPLPD